tara:strand:- start:92 stop:1249 length:1158 start_codon:yes stop_codon:yes gene_type:complete
VSRWRRRFGADGTDGIDPHNRFTLEPDDGPRKDSCFFCKEIFEWSELAEATLSNTPEELWSKYEGHYGKYICRGCRGLGSRKEERKKQEAERRRQEAERRRQEAERRRQEEERRSKEAEKAKKKREKDIARALKSSSNRSLFQGLLESENEVAERLLLDAELNGEALLSHVIRVRNHSIKKSQPENDSLLAKIQSKSRRIICLLSMNPEDFSRNASLQDFSDIVDSPFYSLVLSSDQIKFALSGKDEFEELIRISIENTPTDPGDFLSSISVKFRRALDIDTSDMGDYIYYTLEPMKIQSWDYFNERTLELSGDMIKAKWPSKIRQYVQQPIRFMEKGVWGQFKNFTNSSKPQRDPYRISRCITDFDYAFSDEVRFALDSLLKKS